MLWYYIKAVARQGTTECLIYKGFSPIREEMERQETAEAKLYKALDKLEALIQHNEADISTWIPLEYDLQMTYGTKECAFHPYADRLRGMVREDSKSKIAAEEEGEKLNFQ